MANSLYGLGREGFLTGAIDWATDDIKLILCDTDDYTVSIDTHDYLDDVVAGSRVATSGNFTSKDTTLGVADAADVTFSSVSGDQCEALVCYMDSGGAESTCPLIFYIDTGTGLPVTPSGGDVTVAWDDGANKIFKL